MKYTRGGSDDEVILSPPGQAAASVILLHGLGADGWDFVPIANELDLPEQLPVRFVFPHAPLRPVTINGGYEMRAWYDIRSFTPEGRADAAGLAEASRRVAGYIGREAGAGVPPSRIVLAGFSQGAAVALSAGLRSPQRLGGILAMSGYVPFPAKLEAERSEENADVPILLCHGRMDPVVPVTLGEEARDVLTALGYRVEWHEYAMQHEVCMEELADVSRWLRERLR
jgi:phospholipase/carboxylesterase